MVTIYQSLKIVFYFLKCFYEHNETIKKIKTAVRYAKLGYLTV